jgi:ketosteroid isomerase-like protein
VENIDLIQIKQIFKDVEEAYLQKNADLMLNIFSKEDRIFLIGSSRDEVFDNLQQIEKSLRRDFELANDMTIKQEILSIQIHDDIAWAVSKVDIHMETDNGPFIANGRFTMTLKKNANAQWKVVQSHFSFPTPGPEDL